jgi:hypothetical protein
MTTTTLSSIVDAQRDMRFGYYDGAPGVLASAIAWLAAGVVAMFVSPAGAVWALFIGGMFIFPVGVLIAKVMGRPGGHSRGNALAALAMEGTVLLMLCLPLAFVVSLYRLEWFFPAMLLLIGGRYFTFASLYGSKVFWALGGTLALAAFLLVVTRMPAVVGALAGGLIELAFAIALFVAASKDGSRPVSTS